MAMASTHSDELGGVPSPTGSVVFQSSYQHRPHSPRDLHSALNSCRVVIILRQTDVLHNFEVKKRMG